MTTIIEEQDEVLEEGLNPHIEYMACCLLDHFCNWMIDNRPDSAELCREYLKRMEEAI